MGHPHNLLGEPPATLLPANPEADAELAGGTPAAEVASRHPTVSAAWAALAEDALNRPERRVSFSPPATAGESEMGAIDLDAAALDVRSRFLA